MEGFLSKMKETSSLVWKKADPEDLKPGDHIYAHKNLGSYSHHGIYVGEGLVIHYTRTDIPQASAAPCPGCGYREDTDRGVVRTCLDCFRRGHKKLHSIRRFAYGVPELALLLKKSGTCTMLKCSRTPNDVVRAAYELLQSQGFGEYDLQRNNCEHFATFCRTGEKQCQQTSFFNEVWELLPDRLKKVSS